jgi:hypothetical protein
LRVAVGLLLAGLFLAAMFYVTASESSVECTVCIRFGGVENCATVSGPDELSAVAQATSTACVPLSSGVTESMECGRTPPGRVSCNP